MSLMDKTPAEVLQENQLAIALISLVLIGGAAMSSTGYSPNLGAISGGGLCTQGVSEVNYFSNSKELAGKHFLINAVGDCSDQIIKYGGGKIPKSKLTGTNSNGQEVQAKNSFTAAMTGFTGWAYDEIDESYHVSNEPKDQVYRVQIKDYTYDGDAVQQCQNWQTDPDASPKNPEELEFYEIKSADDVGTKLYCFRAVSDAQIHGFGTDEALLDYKATFEGCSNLVCKSATLTKEQLEAGTTVGSGDYKFYVRSDGSLLGDVIDTGLGTVNARPVCSNDCENPTSDVSWTLAKGSNIDAYVTDVESFKQDARDIINYGDFNPKSHTEIMNQLNKEQAELTSKGTQLLEYNMPSIFDDISSSSDWIGRLQLNTGTLKAYPEAEMELASPSLLFRVDADWLGIGAMVAEPVIKQPPRISMNDQSSKTVNIEVTNTGPKGSVVATIVCQNNPLQGGSYEQTIQSGSTATYSITLDAAKIQNTQDTFTCSVTAKDTDAGNIQDSATLTVDVSSNFVDTDGDQTADKYDLCDNTQGPASNNGCPTKETKCSDGVDNDQDTYVDSEDPDCQGDTPEDPDGDGFVGEDDVCPAEAEDTDGIKDGDGCPDTGTNTEICSNNRDDDNDGYLPSADPDCKQPSTGGIPWIPIIGTVIVLGLAYTFRKPITQKLTGGGK